MEPPPKLDGAVVLLWAWSHPQPFFVMPCSDGSAGTPIHGLAICQYNPNQTYRFSCTATWEVANDFDFDSIEAARHGRSTQYEIESVTWNEMRTTTT